MYLPPHFAARDPAIALELMRAHPFASLVSTDDEGLPVVTHLPLHAEQEEGGPLLLWGHCARPNPHWRYLQARPRALAVFLGPHAYLSPQVYGDAPRVPTWNYLAVHAQVQAQLVEDEQGKDRLLEKLIGDHEPPFVQRWKGFEPRLAQQMLAGIVGFRLEVTQLQCKVKLNQHRPEAHAGQLAAYERGGGNEQALARWMRRFGWTGD